jgi:murein DD-endopeptidase MepM/ murein hydrolase activator NlpD
MKKTIFTIIILTLVFLGILFFSINKINPQQINSIVEKNPIVIPPPTIDEIIEDGIPEDTTTFSEGISYETDNYSVIVDEITPGQAISHILSNYNISNSDIYKLVQASKEVFDLSNIHPEKKYTVICSKDSNKIAQCFVYHQSKTEYIVFDFRDTISVYKGEKVVTKKNNTVSGTIKQGGGLWFSLSKQLGDEKAPPLVDILANSIYAWSIDFFQIQAQDSFIVHFEELYVEDKYVGIGRIHAASFNHKGKILNAFRFKENENYSDYFDEKGNNLRSAFLKSPIDFARVSSRFGNRKHPISGKWKKHKGTDYAAKTGTSIRVTANGTVTYASRKGGYGNCVIVKHNDKFTTLYAHLSKFKPGAGKGSYVKQGDIIGYVGSTGYATGPHLHYEFWLYGKQVDPYKQELPPSLPLKKENTEAFEKIRNEYLKILENFVK